MTESTPTIPRGPAFIPWNEDRCDWSADFIRWWRETPEGYIWSPATESTMAGWVRPNGGRMS
jgi:hypothetical protein